MELKKELEVETEWADNVEKDFEFFQELIKQAWEDRVCEEAKLIEAMVVVEYTWAETTKESLVAEKASIEKNPQWECDFCELRWKHLEKQWKISMPLRISHNNN